MEAIREASEDGAGKVGRSLATQVGTYITLAFGFSWVMWVGAIKLGLGEEYLNIGTAGPEGRPTWVAAEHFDSRATNLPKA